MTPQIRTSKVLLVADRRDSIHGGDPAVRRYRLARLRFDLPLAAYQVSGEAAMIEAAAEKGWIDRRKVVLESLTAIVRAGDTVVMTYFAADAASWLRETI